METILLLALGLCNMIIQQCRQPGTIYHGKLDKKQHRNENITDLYAIHRILTLCSLEKHLVQANSSDGKFVIASLSTSELNVHKIYFEKSAREDIHKPLQSRFCSRSSGHLVM